jgi:hypothetical protein
LIVFIHAPTLGNSISAEIPTASKGMPIPIAMANNALPPSAASRVWLI